MLSSPRAEAAGAAGHSRQLTDGRNREKELRSEMARANRACRSPRGAGMQLRLAYLPAASGCDSY